MTARTGGRPRAPWPPPVARVDAVGLALAITVLWGCNYPLSRYALTHGFDPLAFAAGRFAVAATVFSSIALRREGTVRVSRADLPLLLFCAGVGIVVNQIALAYAFSLASGSTVALFFGMVPVFVVVVAWLRRVEVITRYTWIACAISLIGAALVVLGQNGDLSGSLLGTLFALVAALCIGVYSVAVRPLVDAYSPYRLNAALSLVAAAALLAAGATQIVEEEWSQIHASAWGAFLYAAVAAYVLGNTFYLVAIRKVGSSRASLYANMAPFAGTVLSVVVLTETLAAVQVVGGVMILAAILLAEWPARPRVVPMD